ncbi:phosphonate metabolism transcriptional regulator PhnF [Sneathiella limimaris]|uniref:phosphonate metabolism transcriptional regulator PhnF n=1 Tax=Sneathiella limimaris TaxID=1964213 RepID=UPI00146AE036|nr:phosphonate metabolism transcriptional regulator PhnF [Sneathiella limimaris]
MEWEKGQAIWKQIERQILRDIAMQIFKAGDKLPTEQELAKRFEVNRHTVRQALAALAEANVIRVEQGRGSFVQETLIDYPINSRTRFSQIISSRHRLPDKKLVESHVKKASPTVAKHLKIKPGEPIIEILGVSEADKVPLAVSHSFMPADRFEGLDLIFQQTKSLTEAFRFFGIEDYTRKFTRINAELPSRKIAMLLKQQKSRPILVTESVDVDPKGQPIEYGRTSFNSDRVQLVVEP